MSDKGNEHIRKAFENQEGSIPDFDFEKLSPSETTQSDNHIKNSFESQVENPPKEVWENVQDKLDIDTTWSNISASLDQKPSYFLVKVAAILIAILFLTPIRVEDGNWVVDNGIDQKEVYNKEEALNQKDKSDVALIDSKDQESRPVIEISNERTEFIDEYVELDHIQNNPKRPDLVVKEEGSNNLSKEPFRIDLPPLSLGSIFNNSFMALMEEIAMVDSIADTSRTEEEKKNRKISYGVIGQMNNTWVVDNETRLGFDENSLVENQLSFGNALGVYINISIGENYSVEPQLYFRNSINQGRFIYYRGRYVAKSIQMRSMKFGATMRRNVFDSFYVGTGLYSSVFYKTRTLHDDPSIRNELTYSKLDVEFRLEAGKTFSLYNMDMDMELGVHGELGGRNITSSHLRIPVSLYDTHVFAMGVHYKIRIR